MPRPDPTHGLCFHLQEDKFKFYFSQLSHVVREYEAVLAKVRLRASLARAAMQQLISYW